MALNLVHQTPAQLAARFRAKYRDASGQEQARMAAWLLARIADGDFTDAQVRAAFGQSAADYAKMKVRMTTLRDQHEAVKAAKGE